MAATQSTNIVVYHDYWKLGGATSVASAAAGSSSASSGAGGFGSASSSESAGPPHGSIVSASVYDGSTGSARAGSPSHRVERLLGPYGPEHRGGSPVLGWLPPPGSGFGSAPPLAGGGSVASIASGIPSMPVAPRRRAAADR